MLLAIDIGNTQTFIGLFAKDKLLHHWRLETKKERTADETGVFINELFQFQKISLDQVSGIVVSTVVPPTERIIAATCTKYFGITPIIVGPGIKIDLPIATDKPSEVGADRIVNAIAAYHRYKKDLIIVDFGTATTFDYVSKDGEYQGGLIMPGIGISAEALFSRAERLPRVEIVKPKKVIGKNTIDCLQSGLYHGYAGMVDAVISKMEKEIGRKTRVIATGGLSCLIASGTKSIDDVNEFLTLEGLKLIYEWNRTD